MAFASIKNPENKTYFSKYKGICTAGFNFDFSNNTIPISTFND